LGSIGAINGRSELDSTLAHRGAATTSSPWFKHQSVHATTGVSLIAMRHLHGVWVWVHGPAYYAYGDDCYWLRRQAIITGSPYWWDRYNRYIGYDYY
jgi:hypothetical protein